MRASTSLIWISISSTLVCMALTTLLLPIECPCRELQKVELNRYVLFAAYPTLLPSFQLRVVLAATPGFICYRPYV